MMSKEALECVKKHQFRLLRIRTRSLVIRQRNRSDQKSLIRNEWKREREFEDRVIVPLLDNWSFKYQRQYRCRFPDERDGIIDFFVSDREGSLTLFENKLQIANDIALHKACDQAKRYAQWYRLPSFVVAAPEGMWVYSLYRHSEKLEQKFSVKGQNAAMKELLLKLRSR